MNLSNQMYQDFVNKLLPKIQAGLVITKDYFMDLSGRYIKYLIVSDAVSLILSSLCLVILIKNAKRIWAWIQAGKDHFGNDRYASLFLIIPAALFVFFLFAYSLDCLTKDIFIPEIRIIQNMSDLIKN